MAKLLQQLSKHLTALHSSVTAVRGNAVKSISALQRARSIDAENFRALRNAMRLNGRDRTMVDRFYAAINLAADCPPQAEPVIRQWLSKSESQLCQDLFCVLAHQQKRDGYFVEIGVGLGQSISNTYLLEKEFDWNGLLIEPCRSFHAPIRASRQATLDVRAASSQEGGELTFHEATSNGEFSFADNAKTEDGKAPSAKDTTSYQVQTATLNRILADHGAPKSIDFVSLDTEGSELDILKGFDLGKYHVGVFCIEHNNRPGFVAALDAMLVTRGFRRILPIASAYDAWYVHASIASPLLPDAVA